MIDGVPKNTGNAYLIKGASLPASYAEFKAAVEAGTQGLDLNFNAAGWLAIGTLLSKANLLSDATSAMLDGVSTPDAAFVKIKELIDSGVKIATGSYTGTGTNGISNKTILTFNFVPKLIVIIGGDYANTGIIIPQHNSGFAFKLNSVPSYMTVSLSGTTVSFYASDAQLQCNSSMPYTWTAIG